MVSTCTPDWLQYEGSCYKPIHTKDTWDNSKALCELSDAHMVDINDENEHHYVYGLSLEYNLRGFWIGLRDDPNDNTFKWITGSTEVYRKWADDEPDKKDSPKCVLVLQNFWNDRACDKNQTTICEKFP